MAKPRLEKVEALFYVLKQVAKGGCIRILIHPLWFVGFSPDFSYTRWGLRLPHSLMGGMMPSLITSSRSVQRCL